MRQIPSSGALSGRRRSQRLFASVPITVHGLLDSKRSFEEQTETVVIQAQGALILLAARVASGQSLLVKNLRTQEEQECRVVHLGSGERGKTQVAVEFTQPKPDFWRVNFPPHDWKPLDGAAASKASEQNPPVSPSKK